MNLDGYIRVSDTRGREGPSFISPDQQRSKIDAWAALRGVQIPQWETDLDRSGGKLARPGLDAIMQRIEAGQSDGIAVAALDRLSRAGVADALRLVERIHDAGGQIAVVDLGIDPTTIFGEFAMTLMLALARMQLRQITERWDDARQRAVGRGVHFRAPFGYRKPGPSMALELDPTEAPAVLAAFEARAAGGSWTQVCRALGAAPPREADKWTHGSAKHVIDNRAYLGEARHGEHVKPNAHPAIIDAGLWAAAHSVHGRAPANGGPPAMCAGIIFCAACGHAMSPASSTPRKGKRYLNYRCRKHHGSGRCPAPAQCSRVQLHELMEPHGRAIMDALEATSHTLDLDSLRREAEDADAETAAFVEHVSARTPGYAQGLAKREQDAQTRWAKYRAAVPQNGAQGLSWDDMTPGERNRVLRGAGLRVVVARSGAPFGHGVPLAERVSVTTNADGPALVGVAGA